MASALNSTALDQMLDALTIDRMTLHSGDPGVAGDQNVESVAPVACGFDAAQAGAGTARKRVVSDDVVFTGMTPSVTISHFGLWLNSGTVYKGYIERSSGDTAANADGDYTVLDDDTAITVDMA